MRLDRVDGRVVQVTLSRRNLLALLAKVEGHPSVSSVAIIFPGTGAEPTLVVLAESDSVHYEGRGPGPMHPATEAWIRAHDRQQDAGRAVPRSEESPERRPPMLRLVETEDMGSTGTPRVPVDAGPFAPDLERILSRIPEGYRRSIGCAKGWYGLIVGLERELATLDPDFKVLEVTERYGTLRWDFDCAPAVYAAMASLVDEAETASERTCERCGRAGVLMNRNGWYTTLCPFCARGTGYRPIGNRHRGS